ncbi:autoinducer binding domain-containing protein [uncultured Roseobacter sp.]|uniref:autoinducer binding domain-containing protein n=1 Tax=uncultured Roseobacter sp. TaxID=114847 RepID=UPI002616EA84|nr:autoinducer binding domain-containing protein [uncultured Roseobacter sp.]
MQHWARTVFEDLLWTNSEVSQQTRVDAMRVIELIEECKTHRFRTEELQKTANQLLECVEIEALAELMWSVTTSLGFQNYAIFVLNKGAHASLEPRICTSFSNDWIVRYIESEYQYIDPVMMKAGQSDGWFTFAQLDNNSPAVRDFWLDAEKYRIGRNGICFAITQSEGERIGVSFSSQAPQERIEHIVRKNGLDLCILAKLASDAFCFAASGPAIPDDTLTVVELRFLHVLSTSPNPQDALELSSCFGSNDALQASIRSKLGVDTVFQAVAIAASKGWFNLLPYEANEVLRPFEPLNASSINPQLSRDLNEKPTLKDG